MYKKMLITTNQGILGPDELVLMASGVESLVPDNKHNYLPTNISSKTLTKKGSEMYDGFTYLKKICPPSPPGKI